MFTKKSFLFALVFISQVAFAMNLNETKASEEGLSTTQKVLIGGTVCVGVGAAVVFAAPAVVPTVIAAKIVSAGVALHGALVSAAPTINIIYWSEKGVKYTFLGGSMAKNYLFPSKEKKLQNLFIEEMKKKSFEESLKEAFEKR